MGTWWKEAVGYEIYIRSFQDSNGDGIGDLRGITSRLDYLKSLGVDLLWVTPFYPSPFDDMGYDISDFCAVAPAFGTMDDFDELMREAHARGLKIVVDMVLNHTSDEHPWFVEAKSGKNSPRRDWYVWHPGKNGGPPNNWRAAFGGSAWEWDEASGEYYLHQFSKKQPDLNWRNPEVKAAMFDMLRFWLAKGVDGMRFDVLNALVEDAQFRDNCFVESGLPVDYATTLDDALFDPAQVVDRTRNQPETFAIVEEMCRTVLAKHPGLFTVGECFPSSPEVAAAITGPGKLSVLFQFEFYFMGGMDVPKYKSVVRQWERSLTQRPAGSWNSYYLSNHDMPRHVSKFAPPHCHDMAAKLFAAMLLTLPGTVFVHQGDELGMANAEFETIADYNDIQSVNLYHRRIAEGMPPEEALRETWRVSRDAGRTPMQWTPGPNAGFTTGTPWLRVNPNRALYNVEAENRDDGSTLCAYQMLIALRKAHKAALVYGAFEELAEEDERFYIYLRSGGGETFGVVLNLTDEEAAPPALPQLQGMDKVYGNGGAGLDGPFAPFEAAVFRREE